ncbi:MAG: hypothetical protein O9277_15895 [Magnetospirillum sp.]|nr:hypothetical protein [Magnetospirillum sp.]
MDLPPIWEMSDFISSNTPMQNDIVLRAMATVLGPDDTIVRDVQKAMRTDDGLDWLIAKAAFDGISRDKRQAIADMARCMAEEQVRDLRNLTVPKRGT